MKCEIIRDLLPLYADGIASAETSKTVEEHIAGCEECGKIYEKMTETSEEIADPKIKREIKRDVDYMKKIKNRGKKITAAIVGGVLSATALVLLFLKLFYWGFAVTAEDIDVNYNIRGNSSGGVYIEFTAAVKKGMVLIYDESERFYDDTIYQYITPRTVFRIPFDMPKDQSSFLIAYNTVNSDNQINYELNIILKDTSYSYNIDKMAEEYLEKSS